MMLVKRQLKAYHKAQGLTGKRLKRAVWADVARVKKNQDMAPECYRPSHGIEARFGWIESPEGGRYWSRRASLGNPFR
jgi:hypothetical protein